MMKRLLPYLAILAVVCAGVGYSVAGNVSLGSHVGDYRAGYSGGVVSGAINPADDVNVCWGDASDFCCQWDTAQTPDALICGAAADADQLILGNGGIELTAAGSCTAADSSNVDNNGLIGCPKLTDVAPQSIMIRPQPAFPGGTQTPANIMLCQGQDETLVAIDGADPSVSCAGDNDTVTVGVRTSQDVRTATVLTEGTDWTASASVADTCASLATAVNALAGVGATCTSPNVRITLDDTTCAVDLSESTAGCTTVSVGTVGGGTGGSIMLRGATTGTSPNIYVGSNAALNLTAAAGILLNNGVTFGSASNGSFTTTGELKSATLVSTTLEANLTAGACTAGTWRVDNTTTRELCRCNDAGSAYDCISVTTTNGPTD